MNISSGLQLAKTQDMSRVKFPARAERKLDGVRVLMINCKFYTRTGKEISLPITSAKMKCIKSFMLDLEVTLESGKMKDRPTVSGMLNSAMKGGKIDESLLYFNVIDTMTAESYEVQTCFDKYSERLTDITLLLEAINSKQFRLIPFRDISNLNELISLYKQEVDAGYEGLVVKHYNDIYTFKRSPQWSRFKETKTADLLCVGVTNGEGKYEGMIGALMLEGKVEGKQVQVKVGSGLTDYDRAQPSGTYIGETIEVKYNSLTASKDSNATSLFLPRFVTIRKDKKC